MRIPLTPIVRADTQTLYRPTQPGDPVRDPPLYALLTPADPGECPTCPRGPVGRPTVPRWRLRLREGRRDLRDLLLCRRCLRGGYGIVTNGET